jgi:uncharacterized protein (DUF433 family)
MTRDRINIERGKRSGQPCIRGLRITVWDVLQWLAAGVTEERILIDYPDLEKEDFPAVYVRTPRGAIVSQLWRRHHLRAVKPAYIV